MKKMKVNHISDCVKPVSPELQLLQLLKQAQDFDGQLATEITRINYELVMGKVRTLYNNFPELPKIKFPEYNWRGY